MASVLQNQNRNFQGWNPQGTFIPKGHLYMNEDTFIGWVALARRLQWVQG